MGTGPGSVGLRCGMGTGPGSGSRTCGMGTGPATGAVPTMAWLGAGPAAVEADPGQPAATRVRAPPMIPATLVAAAVCSRTFLRRKRS